MATTAPLFSQNIQARTDSGDTQTIVILWTANEKGRHASTGTSAAAYAAAIENLKKQSPTALLVNLGNFMGPVPATTISAGKLDFQIMERLGYDILRISNHEFIAGEKELAGRIADTAIPVVSGNLTILDSNAKKWEILQCGERSVGFLGLTTSRFPSLVNENMRKSTELESVSGYVGQAIGEMKGRADIIVALSQLTEEEVDEAQGVEGIDLIINSVGSAGAQRSEWISMAFPGSNKAVVARCLDSQPAVYRIELRCAFDREKERWVVQDVKGDMFPITESSPVNRDVQQWVANAIQTIRLSGSEKIGNLAVPISNENVREEQSEMGTVATDLMRNLTRAHVAVLNAGMFRKGLPEGKVTEWDLIEAMPYPNYIVVKRMTGDELEDVLEKSGELSGKGGFLQWSGLETEPSSLGNRIAGVEIESDRTYTVAINDFLAQGGDGYDEFMDAQTVLETGRTVQDLCRDYFEKHGTLIDPDMPMDNELNFWFGKLTVSGMLDANIAPMENEARYPDNSELAGDQLVNMSGEACLDFSRRDFYFGWDNTVEAGFQASWDEDWAFSMSQDTVAAASQVTLYTSHFIFEGIVGLNPYVSGAFETVMIFPDPSNTDPDQVRPGSMKLAGGLECEFLDLFSFQFGFRWECNPFNNAQQPDTGLEAILEFEWEPADFLCINSETEAFSSFDWAGDGLNISSENSLFLQIEDYLKIGPTVTLFYNSREGYLAYIINIALSTEFDF